ncbi:MAG: tRNA (cytidine56-2-O)-methyltransferase [Thermoproteota archaeon]|nr:tRNA (cytidine56-2-O)-methyltransferase [Thermoproteota archaeon]
MEVSVLRLSHRYVRDTRTTTHLFLVARAFGTDKVVYTGQRDKEIEEELKEITETWGGSFKIEHSESWTSTLKDWQNSDGETIHLTMYGLPIQDVINQIRASKKNKLIIVGGAKVPGTVYRLVDWNVAVTSQPHSEVGALSVFLHELFEGRELSKNFPNAKLIIIPQQKGKKVTKTD